MNSVLGDALQLECDQEFEFDSLLDLQPMIGVQP
jgi:hypothetical protein